MRFKKILITGGAGFIGSFLADKLIEQGYMVKILDNLENQVHQGKKPGYLNLGAQFIKGDVRNYVLLERELKDIDVVFHLAARVGVAQSNYEIRNYVDSNIGGMANLLNVVVNDKTKIKKIIMIASMTSYGEGNYKCKKCAVVKPDLRKEIQLKKKDWDVHCPKCGNYVSPAPTDEDSKINNNSLYSLTKNVQEEMLFLIGKMYKIPCTSLRCFNVYGPRQSISNPYTGVTAIFISRLKNGKRPIVYEDGLQSRDFISVHDVVDALIKTIENRKSDYQKINIGSGKPISINDVAQILANIMSKDIKPLIRGDFRKNDIRHCYADIKKARRILNWNPKISIQEGFKELVEWSKKEESKDSFEKAERELRSKKLL